MFLSAISDLASVFLILLALGPLHRCLASDGCDKPGRFGRNCVHECHCEGGPRNCHSRTGECSARCQQRWFGPSCQYSSEPLITELEWVDDNDPETCNPKRSTLMSLNFTNPLQFSWMRLEFEKTIDYPHYFHLTFYEEKKNRIVSCEPPGLKFIKINALTWDVSCNVKVLVQGVKVVGFDISLLCSLNVNAGQLIPASEVTSTSLSLRKSFYGFPLYVGESPRRRACRKSWTHYFSSIVTVRPQTVQMIRIKKFSVRSEGDDSVLELMYRMTVRVHKDRKEKRRLLYSPSDAQNGFYTMKPKPVVMTKLTISSTNRAMSLHYCDVHSEQTCSCADFFRTCINLLDAEKCRNLCSSTSQQNLPCREYCCSLKLTPFVLKATNKRNQPLFTLERVRSEQTANEDTTKLQLINTALVDFLTSIEVEFFGDIICPKNRWGLECEHECICDLPGETCFSSTGYCPSCFDSSTGCTPGGSAEAKPLVLAMHTTETLPYDMLTGASLTIVVLTLVAAVYKMLNISDDSETSSLQETEKTIEPANQNEIKHSPSISQVLP